MEGLIERGHSSWYFRDGVFCLALAGAFLVVQVLVVLVDWAEGVVVPFGFCAAASALIGVIQLGVGSWAWRCTACGVGLHPDRYVEVSEAAEPLVLTALRAGDAQAIVGAVHAHPRGTAKKWKRLWIEHCPNCGRVARVHLERDTMSAKGWPAPVAMEGNGVVALLAIAEVDVPS